MPNLFKTIFNQTKCPLVIGKFNLSLTKQGEARTNLKGYSMRLPFQVAYLVIAWSVCSVMSDCLWRHGLQPARLLCPRNSPGKNTGVGCLLSPGDLPSPGIEPVSPKPPALAGRFLTTELPGKFNECLGTGREEQKIRHPGFQELFIWWRTPNANKHL